MSTEAPEQEQAEVVTPISQIYKWSAWVHVGPGAEECEAVGEEEGRNDCSNPLHTHLWCRLPNQYQHREIREAALAAKARRQRQYRDPESDASVVLDGELEAVVSEGEGAKGAVIEELVAKDWWRDYQEAQADVAELEDEDGTKLYEHIARDVERWTKLSQVPEEERSKDEYDELEAHIMAYNKAVDVRREEAAKPRRDALASKDISELADILRKQRVDMDANGHFAHEYATLEWLACTLTKPAGERAFESRDVLVTQDESVLEAMKSAYIDLENTQRMDQGGAPGNS